MELREAREECRKMLKALKAFQAVDSMLERAELLESEMESARVEVVKLKHEKDAVEEQLAQATERLADVKADIDKAQERYIQQVNELGIKFEIARKDFVARMDTKEAEAIKKYEAILDAVTCAEEVLEDLLGKIAKTKGDHLALVEKYEQFKRSL